MATSDIYEVKEPPWAKKADTPSPKRSRRHRSHPGKTFDEAVEKDLSNTHRRRSRNSGTRRFRHLMKNPAFAKRFWIIIFGGSGLVLVLLIAWDFFFRYPKPTDQMDRESNTYPVSK
ncbi:MAG: hypothetical protein MUC65_05140 [Pontiellaceae bacterium]|jgi:hypothetical protein|nr:hypothetical protein [Pontiellaceae bacterium]